LCEQKYAHTQTDPTKTIPASSIAGARCATLKRRIQISFVAGNKQYCIQCVEICRHCACASTCAVCSGVLRYIERLNATGPTVSAYETDRSNTRICTLTGAPRGHTSMLRIIHGQALDTGHWALCSGQFDVMCGHCSIR